MTKKVIKSEVCKRKTGISKIKIPSSIKKAVLWEKELKKQMSTKQVSELKMDELKIENPSPIDEDFTKSLSFLNIFDQNYRQSILVAENEDTVETRPDLIEELNKLKIGPTKIKSRDSLEFSLSKLSTSDDFLSEEEFNKSLTLNDVKFSRKFRE